MPRGRSLGRIPPIPLVLTGIASVQFGAAIAKGLFDDLGPAGTCFVRLAFAALILLAIWRPDPRVYAGADLRLALVFGLVLGFMNLAFYASIDRIPLGIAVTLEFVGPLGVAVAGSRRRLDLVWVLLAAIGIVLLSGGVTSDLDPLGVAFALAAGALWAAYILVTARAGQSFETGAGLAMAMVVGAFVALPFGVADAGSALLSGELLALGAVVALLSSVIPYSVEMEALRRLSTGAFGVLMSLEPAVAALVGWVLLSQELGALQLVAVGLVVLASAGAARDAAVSPVDR